MTQLARLANGVIVEFFPHGDPGVPGLALVPVPDTAVIGGTVDSSGNYAAPVAAADPFPGYKATAQARLDASDVVAIRCLKAGQAFPTAWQTYVVALRGILTGAAPPATWPTQPAYPAGT